MRKSSHVKGNDGLNFARVAIGEVYAYKLREDGVVIKTSKKRFMQSRVKPYLKRGHATVKIAGKEVTLKNLVAKHFVNGYREGACVETLDGNPYNCATGNLRLRTRSEHGKRSGFKSRAQKVVANGIEYRSIRQAAKGLHVSYQTLLDYMAGKTKRSVLRGTEIERDGAGGATQRQCPASAAQCNAEEMR